MILAFRQARVYFRWRAVVQPSIGKVLAPLFLYSIENILRNCLEVGVTGIIPHVKYEDSRLYFIRRASPGLEAWLVRVFDQRYACML